MSEINPSDAGSRQFDARSSFLAHDGEARLLEEAVGHVEMQQRQTSAEPHPCDCPDWWGKAPESGPICSDCFGTRPSPSQVPPEKPAALVTVHGLEGTAR